MWCLTWADPSFGVGEAAHKLHESSRTRRGWTPRHTRHLIKLKAEAAGKAQIGFYVTFKIGEDESADIYIIRNLHKPISKKYYDSWVAPADKGGWSAKKLEGMFKELVQDEPSDEAQIDPKFFRYESVPEPTNVLYCRAKKEKVPRRSGPCSTRAPRHLLSVPSRRRRRRTKRTTSRRPHSPPPAPCATANHWHVNDVWQPGGMSFSCRRQAW